jgi:hypothetical protein
VRNSHYFHANTPKPRREGEETKTKFGLVPNAEIAIGEGEKLHNNLTLYPPLRSHKQEKKDGKSVSSASLALDPYSCAVSTFEQINKLNNSSASKRRKFEDKRTMFRALYLRQPTRGRQPSGNLICHLCERGRWLSSSPLNPQSLD